MKTRNTLQLGIIVVILGCGLYLLDEHLERRQRVRVQVQRVFDITTDPVTTVGFAGDGQRIEFVRKGESWFLQEPVRARANTPKVERIVAALEALRREDTITREQRELRGLTLADYGLQDATRQVSVETATGRAETLHLGGRTPFGNAVYGRIDRDDSVFTLPGAVLGLYPDDLASLRDRTLLYGSPANTERIDIHRRNAGFLQLVRRKSGWILQQPLATKADAAAVRNLLDALFALRVATFHWDAEPESAANEETAARLEMTRRGQFEAAGLAEDAARLKITVWTEGDRLGQDLLIGTDVAGIDNASFARRGGVDAVYTVPSEIIDACSRPVESFRNRSVFHRAPDNIGFIRLQQGDNQLELERLSADNGANWRLRTPLRAPADPEAVKALIAHLLELKATAFLGGSESPVSTTSSEPPMRITLASAAPVDASAEPATTPELTANGSTTLVLEKAADGVRTAAIATREDDRFTLDAAATADLDASLISPLRFRHRLMLAIDAAAVSRIQVTAPSITCRVARDPATPDAWLCPDEPTLNVDTTAVANLLAAATRIEASRFVAFMPPDLAAYGLDKPSATVTFGFRADEGLQNTLLLGSAADDAWLYAMVQGHEFVFLLAESQIARLLQPLCTKPPEIPSPAPAVPDTVATNAAATNAEPVTATADGNQAP